MMGRHQSMSADEHIREVLNKGFKAFTLLSLPISVLLAVASYFLGFYSDALWVTASIPIILLCFALTHFKSISGIVLLVLISIIGAAWSIQPSTTYSGPAVSIFLIIGPLIATRFLDPIAGVWALFMQLFAVMFSLVVKDVSAEVAVRYGFFALLDVGLITGAFIISSNILRDSLRSSYESGQELRRMYDDLLTGWSQALELRNKETQGHTDRVTRLTLLMAAELGFTDEELMSIRRGALLHDIGKTGIPDSILLKNGPLTPIERDIMRLHPTYAYQWLRSFAIMQPALDIPYCHHERWDGTGYPRGLRGKEIPLAARLFAIADVYDALTSNRPYRKAISREEALQHIQARAGQDFDPGLIELFLQEEERLFNQTNDSEDPA